MVLIRRPQAHAFAQAYNLLGVAVVAVDDRGAVLYANDRGRSIVADAASLPLAIARTSQNPLIHTVGSAMGRLSAFEIHWSVPPDEGGVRVAIVRSVSDEHRALSALSASEAFFSDVFDAFPGSVITLDEHGTIVLANAQWRISARANGLDVPDDGVGCNYLAVCDLVSGVDRETAREVAAGIRAVLARTRMLFECDYALTGTPDGRWCHLTVVPLDHPGALMVHSEITASLRDHAQLQASERRFRAVFDHAIDGMILLDDDLRIVQANHAAEQIFGSPSGELVGRSASAVMGSDDVGILVVEWEKARLQRAAPFVVFVSRDDATRRRIEASLSHDAAPGRHLLVLRDVTDRWRLTAEPREAPIPVTVSVTGERSSDTADSERTANE